MHPCVVLTSSTLLLFPGGLSVPPPLGNLDRALLEGAEVGLHETMNRTNGCGSRNGHDAPPIPNGNVDLGMMALTLTEDNVDSALYEVSAELGG